LVSRRVARLQAKAKAESQQHAAIASKAAGYIRVSTDEQATHGHGLEVQEKAIRAFADSQGYELVALIADPGVSGATRPAEREGFGKLIGLAASGEFSILLVWKFDRLARQIVFAVTAVSELSEQHNVAIRSVTEPIDTATPMGRTIFAVLAGMAEQEREAITERTWHGRREKGTRGGYSCGGVPYGYDVVEGKLVVNASEAAIVRRIFAMRARGSTYQQIADVLNAGGHTTRRGKPWRGGGVAHILDNPVYAGRVEYLFRRFGAEQHVLIEGEHEAIIAGIEDAVG
jgi:site-specific DNA recombinase